MNSPTPKPPYEGAMLMLHIPEDENLLAAMGAVTVAHTHLDYILRMTVKSLCGVTVDEALAATEFQGSAQLRERVGKLARQQLGEGPALVKIQALLSRAKRLTEERNRLTHGLFAKYLDGDVLVRSHGGVDYALPQVSELLQLTQAIVALRSELNTARLEGFLLEALKARK